MDMYIREPFKNACGQHPLTLEEVFALKPKSRVEYAAGLTHREYIDLFGQATDDQLRQLIAETEAEMCELDEMIEELEYEIALLEEEDDE